jgi:CRISPR-associated exonuclease Cas4
VYAEDDLLPISALQHLLYCDRQCALIHVERAWAENALTVQGRHLHERPDRGRGEARGGVGVARRLPLRSLRLGLFGLADVVEFHPSGQAASAAGPVGIAEPSTPVPFPVEYKRGRPKAHDADRVQLCAQALCLEEMFDAPVPAGALFYGKTRRRETVAFDAALRGLTEQTARRLHELLASGRTPPPVYEEKKCGRCSLVNLCLPRTADRRSASAFVARALAAALAGPAPGGSD